MREIEVGQRWVHKKTRRLVRVEYVGIARVDVFGIDSQRRWSVRQSTLRAAYEPYWVAS